MGDKLNIFLKSRRRMTLLYSIIMVLFLAVLMVTVHSTMEWAITSEQARELQDTATDVTDITQYMAEHAGDQPEEMQAYKSTNDRLFFYVFDGDGRLTNFARASFRIEPFVLDQITAWHAAPEDVVVFSREKDRHNRAAKVMMTSRTIYVDGSTQTIYVGKDITTLSYGLEKATYALVVTAILMLIIALFIAHLLAGKAMVPLKTAYEKQRQFAADASHELRTPLAVVMASADLLENDPSIQSPFLKQVIADVRDEVKKMSKLVSDLLVVARSDNQALKLTTTKFDFADILGQTTRLMGPLAEQKHITIDAEELPETIIHADEQKLRQLALIFIDNAVKYTPDGGRVTVRLAPYEHGTLRFSVQDTGIGIAPADQEKIFDRFYRVDKARSREMGGNGLGLAIAQEIVKLYHGHIAIDSELGKGTTFTISLKVKGKGRNK